MPLGHLHLLTAGKSAVAQAAVPNGEAQSSTMTAVLPRHHQ